MIKIKTLGISLAVATTLSFSGCGSSDSTNPPAEEEVSNDVTVERGATYDANVTDANGQVGEQKNGQNIYTFATTPKFPITVKGGWIDVNGDGELDTNDTMLSTTMTSYSNNVTPITTYISDSNESTRNTKLQALANITGVATTELKKVASKANTNAILTINALYQEMIDQNTTNVNINNVQTTLSVLQNDVDLTGLTDPKLIAQKIEKKTMSNLLTKGKISALSMNDLDEIQKFKVFGIIWKNRKNESIGAKRSYSGNTVKVVNNEIVMTSKKRAGNWSSRAELRAKLNTAITSYTAKVNIEQMASYYGKTQINAYFPTIDGQNAGEWKQLQTSITIKGGSRLNYEVFWEGDTTNYTSIEGFTALDVRTTNPGALKANLECKVSIVANGVKFEVKNLDTNTVYPSKTIDLSSEQLWTDSTKNFGQILVRSVFDDRTPDVAKTDYSNSVVKLIDLDTE